MASGFLENIAQGAPIIALPDEGQWITFLGQHLLKEFGCALERRIFGNQATVGIQHQPSPLPTLADADEILIDDLPQEVGCGGDVAVRIELTIIP